MKGDCRRFLLFLTTVVVTTLLVGCTSTSVQSSKTERSIHVRVSAAAVGGSAGSLDVAIANTKPGETIELGVGDYYGNYSLDVSGSVAKPIRIIAPVGATIRGTLSVRGANVQISGLEFNGATSATSFSRGNAITVRAPNFKASRLSIRNYQGWGVYFLPDLADSRSVAPRGLVSDSAFYNVSGGISLASSGVALRNTIRRINTFRDPTMAGDAFRVFGSHVRILQNKLSATIPSEVRPVHADAVQSWDDTRVVSKDVIVARNQFGGWYNQGVLLENDAWGPSGNYYISDWHIRNNIFNGFESWGICAGKPGGGIPSIFVQNNIFSGLSSPRAYYGIGLSGTAGKAVLVNNYIENVSRQAISTADGSTASSSTNVAWNVSGPGYRGLLMAEERPSFVAGTFKSARGSSLIDAGTHVTFPKDIGLRPREAGRRVDVGAWESSYSVG